MGRGKSDEMAEEAGEGNGASYSAPRPIDVAGKRESKDTSDDDPGITKSLSKTSRVKLTGSGTNSKMERDATINISYSKDF